jgi:hypothetical protein
MIALLVVLGVLGLFWLAALTTPGNGTGVVLLEVMTALAAVPAVLHFRTVNRRLRGAVAVGGAAPARSRQSRARGGPWAGIDLPAPLQPPALRFDPDKTPDLVLRPRLTAMVGAACLLLGFPAVLLWLQWQASFFDARTPLIVFGAGAGLVLVFRSRIVVVDRVMWRRRFRAYRPVSLDRLAFVRYSRARYLKQEGPIPTGLLRLADRYGRTTTVKPALWRGGGKQLVVIVAACVRSQTLSVDDETARRLAPPGPFDPAASAPAWAYALAPPTEVPATAAAPRPSTFWTRRNPDGTQKRTQFQRLIPMIGAMIVIIPVTIVADRVGTDAIRTAHCAADRPLWTNAPDFAGEPIPAADLAPAVTMLTEAGVTGQLYRLEPSDIANSHNSTAVRRDAATMNDGLEVDWSKQNNLIDAAQIERFSSHAAALQFQRDYAEDHCHEGDRTFQPSGIPGGVGFRCSCTGTTVDDRIAWVRGDTRIQVIASAVPSRQGHGQATDLAQAVLAAQNH